MKLAHLLTKTLTKSVFKFKTYMYSILVQKFTFIKYLKSMYTIIGNIFIFIYNEV